MYTDLFQALLERRNRRKHPLLSALLYEFCSQAVFFWHAGLDPQVVPDPVWQALQDYADGGTLSDQLALYELEDFSSSAEGYITDIQDYRGEHMVHAPEASSLFTHPNPTAEEKRKFTQAAEKHFGSWDNLYAYIRTWGFLIGDWRLRSGVHNSQNYLLRKNSVLVWVPGLGEPVYWQVWAWWVKLENTTTVHIGLLTPDKTRDSLRPYLIRNSNLEGDSPWPSGLFEMHSLNYNTGEVAQPENLLADVQIKLLLGKLASVAEMGVYPPTNLLRHPSMCQQCGFYQFCYNEERPTELALRGLEDVPTWQSAAR